MLSSSTIQIGIHKTMFKLLPEPIVSVKKAKSKSIDLSLATLTKLKCSKELLKN